MNEIIARIQGLRRKINSIPRWVVGLVVILILFGKYWWIPLVLVLAALNYVWHFITPTNYTLFLYKDGKTVDVLRDYPSERTCKEKGIQLINSGKSYDDYLCGKRCKDDALSPADCEF